MIAKEGYGIVFGMLILTLLASAAGFFLESTALNLVATLFTLLFLFCLFFFRDPERQPPDDPLAIVAAADGKIVAVKEVPEDRFLKSNAVQVSIFLSVFDVHVNRIPMSGTVRFFEYMQGKFLAAFNQRASTENEQTIIGIEHAGTRILVKQIAGLIARRIVCHVKEGDAVERGSRFGLIKFGSRVDYLLPEDVKVAVKVGQRVVAGESVIGIIPAGTGQVPGDPRPTSVGEELE